MAKRAETPTRDEKIKNLIQNHSLIFMGMFEEAFSDIAEKMTEALAAGAGAMADALGGTSAGTDASPGSAIVKEAKEKITPEVRAQIGMVFSDLREEMTSQWPKNEAVFRQYISDPAFDRGIRIVEGYDFGRPKLTEELSDQVLASYVFLVKSSDLEIAKMFKELADWQNGLPRPPWASPTS